MANIAGCLRGMGSRAEDGIMIIDDFKGAGTFALALGAVWLLFAGTAHAQRAVTVNGPGRVKSPR